MPKREFTPDWATHPADHIKEYLETRGWKQADLARASGLTQKSVSDIMTKDTRLNARTAIALEKALGLKARVWLALQANWDLHEERRKQ